MQVCIDHSEVAALLRRALDRSIEPAERIQWGAEIHWVGYVLSVEVFEERKDEIRRLLADDATEFGVGDGHNGRVFFGRQAPHAKDVPWNAYFPPLAFMDTDAVNLPVGTVFVVLHVRSLDDAREILRLYPSERVDPKARLMDAPAIRVLLRPIRNGAETGAFVAYFTTADMEKSRLG